MSGSYVADQLAPLAFPGGHACHYGCPSASNP